MSTLIETHKWEPSNMDSTSGKNWTKQHYREKGYQRMAWESLMGNDSFCHSLSWWQSVTCSTLRVWYWLGVRLMNVQAKSQTDPCPSLNSTFCDVYVEGKMAIMSCICDHCIKQDYERMLGKINVSYYRKYNSLDAVLLGQLGESVRTSCVVEAEGKGKEQSWGWTISRWVDEEWTFPGQVITQPRPPGFLPGSSN